MKKKSIITILIILIIISGTGWLYVIYASNKNDSYGVNIFFNPKMRRFVDIMKILQSSYYRDVPDDELIEAAIEGMLKSLDPHSVYLFKNKDIENFTMSTKGEFGGIGFRVGIKDDFVTVISPIENTPASRAGIRAGDRIIKIDTILTKGMDIDMAVSLMRGEPGTKVKLFVDRFGKNIEFDIIREIISIQSIPYYSMLDDSTGYIRVVQFTENVSREFEKALETLFTKHKAKKLIVDLRYNPGGLLNEAINMTDYFIPKGLTIVITKSKNPMLDNDFKAEKPMYYGNFPLIVLVNEGSASASEIFAGAVQDWERGIILGDTTFGKGSVQSVYDFSKYDKIDGQQGILKFTTAKYYTPTGRSIDKELIKYERTESDSHIYYSLGQMKRQLLGGGGIIPDYIFNDAGISDIEIEILRKQVTFDFVLNYLNKRKLSEKEIIELSSKIIDEYFDFLKKREIDYEGALNNQQIYSSIVKNLKFEFARQTSGDRLFYEISVKNDDLIDFSLKLLNGSKDFEGMLNSLPLK